ncbi:hypothetical protein [Flavimaricola marinus]|uniref:AAA+ family ATPase n=1 Tax=Flavimaricola marinus TaxID=1819565 RepID=A0A238LFW2_9RHOB|nr:hypothetical protein [Flavimaricola marinus]SMY08521.1 hypothetical protein LOM8899_02674 [Flavimaricola marinus]
MKQFALPLALCLSAVPALAQDDEGFSLMDEGARMFLRGLMSELEPTFEELEGFAQEIQPAMRQLAEQMGPALSALMSQIDDIRHYEAPVILDNGDILIRRSPDAPPYVPAEPDEPEVQQDDPPEQIDL